MSLLLIKYVIYIFYKIEINIINNISSENVSSSAEYTVLKIQSEFVTSNMTIQRHLAIYIDYTPDIQTSNLALITMQTFSFS